MDKIDQEIQAYLASRLRSARDSEAPSAEDYYRFVTDELRGEELGRMLSYLQSSPEDQKFVLNLRQMAEKGEWDKIEVPENAVRKAKALAKGMTPATTCPHCGKGIRVSKAPLNQRLWMSILWFALAAVSFGASFVFKRYFMQCLALMLFFGFKWVMDLRQAKTQILVYKALQASGEDSKHSHLHRHERPL